MNDKSRRAMYAQSAKPFRVGAFVKSNNNKFGQITKMIHTNPDGTKFFEVAYSYGKEQNRSDHELKVVDKGEVRLGALRAIKEIKQRPNMCTKCGSHSHTKENHT